MHSPRSVAAIGGILVIVVLFVALVILATVAKLIRIGQVLGGTSSRASSRHISPPC
jgi:hypothetical protein